MGRGIVGASCWRTLEASTNDVVPTVPVLTGAWVSPMGTTAEVSVFVEIEAHGTMCQE